MGEHFLRILGHSVFATSCVCILVYNTIGFTRFERGKTIKFNLFFLIFFLGRSASTSAAQAGGRQPPACAADVDFNMLGFCKGAGDEVDGERGGRHRGGAFHLGKMRSGIRRVKPFRHKASEHYLATVLHAS